MRGKWYKKLNKRKHFSKDEKREHKYLYGEIYNKLGRQFSKYITKLHRLFHIKHENYDGDNCCFWYDENDGFGYRECCGLLGGLCSGGKNCFYEQVERMFNRINGDAE